MKIYSLLKNEKGTSIVMLSMLFTVAIGLVALVVDIGNVVIQKNKLQNAVDATVLAAAQDLPDAVKTSNSAYKFIELNGFKKEDFDITFSNSNRILSMTGNKTIYYTFAKVLGFDKTNVHISASAESRGSVSEVFEYAVFSGSTSKELIFNSKFLNVNGHTHTNNTFKANGQDIAITGRCQANKSVLIDGQRISIPNRLPNTPFIEMPDYSEIIKLQAQAAGTYYVGDRTFNAPNLNLSNPIFVQGKVTINGSGFTGKGTIVATGEIILNGSNINISSQESVFLYSRDNKVTLNGDYSKVKGILYAPNSVVTLNGKYQEVQGRVIGNEVVLNGEYQSVDAGSSSILSVLPVNGSIRLIR